MWAIGESCSSHWHCAAAWGRRLAGWSDGWRVASMRDHKKPFIPDTSEDRDIQPLQHPSEKRKLQVNIVSPIHCSMSGRKCTVIVEPKINQSQPDFTKSRSGYILAVPGN
ncbi:hypothetical protein FQN60_002792 [Etheostoma spectabile]|uniref:Uncharacterized protein n=1 Tax=Etheostoma spectabile TaxID=54343 RepID=A0A5J5CMK8_9PERO|nr:hypothetical protein FQN60_002792 [Etheostoma spectabile]